MKRNKSLSLRMMAQLLCSVLLLSLPGCDRAQEAQIYNKVVLAGTGDLPQEKSSVSLSSGKDEKELSGHLTVYMGEPGVFDGGVLGEHARAFEELHPGVTIELVGPEVIEDMEVYAQQTTVGVMAGGLADILSVRYLPYYQYSKSGLLEELYFYMDKDEDFERDDYFANVFRALEYQGGLYSVMSGFVYHCVRLNTDITAQLDFDLAQRESIRFDEIYAIYQQAMGQGLVDAETFTLSHYVNKDFFEMMEYTDYLDENAGKATFLSDGFLGYLNQMKEIQWFPTREKERLNATTENWLDGEELALFFPSFFIKSSAATAYVSKTRNVSKPLFLESSGGNRTVQMSDSDILCILKDSPNKELAWEFIKFQIEEKDHSQTVGGVNYMDFGLPINRSNTRQLLQKAFPEGSEEAVAQVEEWASSVDTINMATNNVQLNIVITALCKDYYENRTTAAECAQRVQERVEMYLRE